MLLALFVLAALLSGHTLAEALWAKDTARRIAQEEALSRTLPGEFREREPGPIERASASLMMALAIMIGVDWILALTHLFTTRGLVVSSILLLICSYPLISKLKNSLNVELEVSKAKVLGIGILLLPVLVWLTYVMWRGAVVFVGDHDGLGYHMPKAIMIVRAHGYGYFDASLRAIPTFPMNHELLLANVIALTGTDEITEWVSSGMYILFGIVAGGMIERWWGKGIHILIVMLITWGMPVALLHSGAHKNDLMFASCALAALSFSARWATTSDRTAMVVALAGVFMAGGTKVSGVFVAIAMLPALIYQARKVWSSRLFPSIKQIVGYGALSLGMALVLGWSMYLLNYAHDKQILDTHGGGYGAWQQLWMLPTLIFIRPFCGPGAVWVPWQGKYWFCPKYDLFFSTLGLLASFMMIALPIGIALFRKRAPEDRRPERFLTSLGALILCLGIAPASIHPPFGFFIEHTRYLMFAVPVLAGWTIVPIVRAIENAGRVGEYISYATAFACVALFSYEAYFCGKRDVYDPFDFFMATLKHPEQLSRISPIDGSRSVTWFDHNAGQEDSVAFDGELTGWPYPLFGRELRRKVTFLHSETGKVDIPDDVKWVVIDRAWNGLFNNPGFVDLSNWKQFIGRGTPLDEDLVVFRLLEKDPRFQLVYLQQRTVQAVFVRR